MHLAGGSQCAKFFVYSTVKQMVQTGWGSPEKILKGVGNLKSLGSIAESKNEMYRHKHALMTEGMHLLQEPKISFLCLEG